MAIPQRVFDDQIYAFSSGLGEILYGRALHADDTWLALCAFESDGAADGIALLALDVVDEIQLSSERLTALRSVAVDHRPNFSTVQDFLGSLTRGDVLVAFEFFGENEKEFGVIDAVDDEWLQWRRYTRQGEADGLRWTQTTEIRQISAGGITCRRVERNAALASIQGSIEGNR